MEDGRQERRVNGRREGGRERWKVGGRNGG